MDFKIDKTKNKVLVKKEFAASPAFLWAAWTESRLLDLWWAPKPWKVRTKTMDFREGGSWIYAMTSPEGEEHWSRNDYLKIDPMRSFLATDSFCDKDGKINHDFPQSKWLLRFDTSSEKTLVTVEMTTEKPEDLEKYIEMGFKEGFTMSLENLDELIRKSEP